jgi:PhzF family phenazine biosynthesis protein
MSTEITFVNLFSDRPFKGDRVAVCPLEKSPLTSWMQTVATELNSPITAFCYQPAGATNRHLRCFTPQTLVPFCTHGALAAAHLFADARQKSVFHTENEELEVQVENGWLAMELPARKTEPAPAPPALHVSLGVVPIFVGKNNRDYLVALSSEEVLRALQPDFSLLRNLDAERIVITARAETTGYDYVCRAFAPHCSETEECVSADAHALLAPFWAQRRNTKSLVALHASKREGTVRVQMLRDRIRLSLYAVITMQVRLCEQGLEELKGEQ